jgi:sulfur carrier protein ThiS
MQITIRLLASYRRYLPEDQDVQGGYTYDIPPGQRVGDILANLPIPETDAFTFLLNGGHAQRDQVLREGDILAVFPAVGGG